MTVPILSTKWFIPPPRPQRVLRSRLIARLNEGLHRKLTLVAAPAGSGKTTLVSEWVSACGRPAAWLSLDEGENDPARFLAYLTAAVQTVEAKLGEGVLQALRSPQPPPIESLLTIWLNDIATAADPFLLVLDDYHAIHAKPAADLLAFLLDHLPPQMHLVLATREIPDLPLSRLRVRDQITELQAADLRFTLTEAGDLLNRVMGLSLSSADIAGLEARTEGWAAGLQLAGISLQGQQDAAGFIQSFTGSHRYILDYLVEEVLHRQPEETQAFLLRTSILDRMCGPLCDAMMRGAAGESQAPAVSGQETLERLERANLFLVALDQERRWYRYHHLFAELLRERLQRSLGVFAGSSADKAAAELHIRASAWYEAEGLELEALQHAAAAHDVDRAARLVEGRGMPLLFRGGAAPVIQWLDSLPPEELDPRPSLWVIYASADLLTGRISGVEPKLQAAERALRGAEQDGRTRDLIGHIASIRAALAVSRHQGDIVLAQSLRALEYLHEDNLPVRTASAWTLGCAYQLQGNRTAAAEAYTEALSVSRRIGHVTITVMAALGLGLIQEADNRLDAAAETYRQVLVWAGDPPLPSACEAHLGLARISYQRNDLEAAEAHAGQAIRLARMLQQTDRAVAGEVFQAGLMLARGEVSAAAAILAQAEGEARELQFGSQLPSIAGVQVRVLLQQGRAEAAAELARKHGLPLSEARVHLAQGDPAAALSVVEPLREKAEAEGLADERLKAMLLQAAALYAYGQEAKALRLLAEVLTAAVPAGFIRLFVDEGAPVQRLLSKAAAQGVLPAYTGRLLEAFQPEERGERTAPAPLHPDERLIEPLSERELEVLQLIAQGLSNQEIGERLFLALSTVKGHNRHIFDKLGVQRRTEAVARARRLGLVQS
ncbi:LuxR C-terminal-related transcriptional regulator [Paenibacillus caseinilyticus]|uniref:Transcriptional regulator n=1 Tax=Paenibacillus mucilaginosus K02 TaxID=997761 RepID=I0BEC4_9BACL|nr:LuxR C-terminal-related transcriptional regulator [Paenibacillus mucilaginosus]AFH60721.1 transcriptional regulator [Paenibacillus mucilaginosus K02]